MILRPVAPPVEYGITKRLARAGNAAIAFLRSLGTSAHVWLPGANGVSVASLPSNNYLLSDGSTGYSTVDGVDGLTLDGMGALGSELVTNGDFSSGATGWTEDSWTISGGSAQCTNNSTSLVSNSSSVVGKTYKVEFTATIISGTLYVSVGANYAGSVSFTTSGRKTVFLVAGASANRTAEFYGGAVTCTIDDVSVKEYTGIHLTQATTANKPLVRRGMLNLLTYSNTLTDVSWLKGGHGTITYDAVGVDGAANTAATITTTTAVLRSITRVTGVTSSVGAAFTTAFWLKKTTGALARYPVISLEEVSLTRLLGICTVDTSNGVVTAWSAYTGFPINAGSTVSIVSSGDYWLVTLSGFCSGATATVAGLFPTGVSTSTQSTGVISGSVGPDVICGGSLVASGTWTAAQILAEGGIPTTTATAASNPSSGKYWWSFDGSNDILVASSVPLQIADDCAVIAGVCVNTVAAQKIVFSERSNVSGTPIVASLFVDATNKPGFGSRNDAATLAAAASPEALTAPAVIAGRQVGNVRVIRVNGIQKATDTTALGSSSAVTTASVGAHNLGAPVDFFNGSISIVIVIKGTLTDAEMLILERFAASVTPGAPVF